MLSPWHYKNIVVIGLRAKDSDWVKGFIQSYKRYLPENDRVNAYTYNLAKFHFYERNFSKVIQLLSSVEYNDIFYNLDSKSMLMKTYYELDEIEPLYSLMDSFRIFLRRKKLVSDHHRTNHLNFIKFLRKMAKVNPRDKKKVLKLKEQLGELRQVADVSWLWEKMNELDPVVSG